MMRSRATRWLAIAIAAAAACRGGAGGGHEVGSGHGPPAAAPAPASAPTAAPTGPADCATAAARMRAAFTVEARPEQRAWLTAQGDAIEATIRGQCEQDAWPDPVLRCYAGLSLPADHVRARSCWVALGPATRRALGARLDTARAAFHGGDR
jgi:hypothetical protein